MTEPSIIINDPEVISLVSPKMIHLNSNRKNVAHSVCNNTAISALKRFTVATGEAIGLFTKKMGVKLFANKGKIEIQAQNDA